MFDYRVSQTDRGNGTAGLGVRLTYMYLLAIGSGTRALSVSHDRPSACEE